MKKTRKRRKFTAALKQRAVERIKQGESVSAVAKEYQIERSRLYDWRDQWDAGRPFNGGGRPPKPGVRRKLEGNELSAAQARIAELEQKVGQQTLTLDFLRGALRQVDRSPSTSSGSGAAASSSTSGE
jgi:transposase-like protein